jgi:hypothetical protein
VHLVSFHYRTKTENVLRTVVQVVWSVFVVVQLYLQQINVKANDEKVRRIASERHVNSISTNDENAHI